jgi:hypothetical protein
MVTCSLGSAGMDEFLGGLVALLIVGGLISVGGLLATSHAVLYWEEADVGTTSSFTCHYFTGTRTVKLYRWNTIGCPRFVPVGQ